MRISQKDFQKDKLYIEEFFYICVFKKYSINIHF